MAWSELVKKDDRTDALPLVPPPFDPSPRPSPSEAASRAANDPAPPPLPIRLYRPMKLYPFFVLIVVDEEDEEDDDDEGFVDLGLEEEGSVVLALVALLWLERRAGDRAEGPGLAGESDEAKTKGGPGGGWKGSLEGTVG